MEVLLDRPDREGIQPLVVALVFGSMAFRAVARPNLAFSMVARHRWGRASRYASNKSRYCRKRPNCRRPRQPES